MAQQWHISQSTGAPAQLASWLCFQEGSCLHFWSKTSYLSNLSLYPSPPWSLCSGHLCLLSWTYQPQGLCMYWSWFLKCSFSSNSWLHFIIWVSAQRSPPQSSLPRTATQNAHPTPTPAILYLLSLHPCSLLWEDPCYLFPPPSIRMRVAAYRKAAGICLSFSVVVSGPKQCLVPTWKQNWWPSQEHHTKSPHSCLCRI